MLFKMSLIIDGATEKNVTMYNATVANTCDYLNKNALLNCVKWLKQ